jgi:N-acetylmuramoyl-L-alanine amidase
MRVSVQVLLLAVLALVLPEAASAAYVHVVAPGESLSSIAAADGLSLSQLAAANGMATDAQLVAGTGVQIPPQQGAGVVTSQPAATGDGDGDSDDTAAAPAVAPPVNSAATVSGSYVVQPGDTLSAIAARAGVSVAQLAVNNGIDPNRVLLAGSMLRLSGAGGSLASPSLPSGTTVSASSQPVGAPAEGSPVNPPYPTPESVSSSQVGSIAAANGVPAALADAIAYQESGFNNAAVSIADARGVMQILPGTWDWIQRRLVAGAPPLAPASATDNIRGGVLLLRSLLNSTGGDPALAAAGYYQGLPSVRRFGVYPSTQQYVNNVMALERQFGGG